MAVKGYCSVFERITVIILLIAFAQILFKNPIDISFAVENTMKLCCNSTTYLNKCDFMEKYGCESFDITENKFKFVRFVSKIYLY